MVSMAWFATGPGHAMGAPSPASAPAYTWAYRDTNGDWLDPPGPTGYDLPGPIPAKDFWSVVVYDLWTRSMLANGQPLPEPQLLLAGRPRPTTMAASTCTSVPSRRPGKKRTGSAPCPDTGWFPIIRLYGPLEAWIDGSWKPNDLNQRSHESTWAL